MSFMLYFMSLSQAVSSGKDDSAKGVCCAVLQVWDTSCSVSLHDAPQLAQDRACRP